MHSKERVMTTLYHEEPDMVPLFDFLYNEISIRKILGKSEKSKVTLEDYMKAQRTLSFDLVAAYFSEPRDYRPKIISPDLFIDEWGIKWKSVAGDNVPFYVDGTIKSMEDLQHLQPPNPYAEGRTESILEFLRRYGDEVAVAPVVAGPFNMAWLITGFEVFVRALYTNQSFIRKLLTMINEYYRELGKIAIDLGAELLWISDDLGDKNGPILTPRQFRTFVKPLLKNMVETFKKRGVWVLLHCDGNVMPLMDDLVEVGIDAFHPCERKAHMSLKK